MSFRVDLPKKQSSIIKVIGVGGGGGNAVNYMYNKGITGVDFYICNTDTQALESSPIPNKIQLGETLSEGLGAGSDPEVGKQCAEESSNTILEVFDEATKMVFITAGMGGGTGTGAAPVIARIAKEKDLLTVGIVTIPFKNEGPSRNEQAQIGIEYLRPHVDALLIITNDRILEMYHNLRYSEAFAKADDVLCTAAKGIAEIITVSGKMNVDFRDVKTAMENSGRAIMGTGIAEGDDRAVKASEMALESPLLDNTNIDGAKHILLNISYENEEPYANEIDQITAYFQNVAGQNAQLKFGVTETQNLGNSLSVTVIATGFETNGDIVENVLDFELDDELSTIEVDLTDGIVVTDESDTKDEGFSFGSNPDLFSSPEFRRKEHDLTFGDRHNSSDRSPSNSDTPAYLRFGVKLEDIDEAVAPKKLYLEEKDGETIIKNTPNKFLNKNVD